MYINACGYYIPEDRVPNEYFLNLNGLTDEWITQRTGIKTRSKARKNENVTTMSLEALKNALPTLPYDIKEVDLLIAASYSPYDTVGTTAHVVQQIYDIPDAKAFAMSSACSSFENALEIAEAFFISGKATKALILSADMNSAYANETDPKAGHLWGDAAAVFFVSKESCAEDEPEVIDIMTEALGHIGEGPYGVMLKPYDGGIEMPDGKNVFIQACKYMPKSVEYLLDKNNLTWDNLSYFIGHQANMRILKNIADQLDLPHEKLLHNIEELGNTGSVSSALVYAQNKSLFKKGDLVAITVFGGGYSTGACLIKH